MRLVMACLVIALAVTGCSSSKRDTVSGVNTVPDNVTTGAASGSCPFTGSTQTQTEPGAGGATTLTKANPSTAGCIDNVQLNFSPKLATSTTAYQDPPPSGGGAVLVMHLDDTTLGSGLKAGSTTNAHGLNYVQRVDVATSSNGVTVSVTLDKKRPFLVNSSQVPPELELAIG